MDLAETKELVEHLGFENTRIQQEMSDILDEKALLANQLKDAQFKVQTLLQRTMGSPGSGSDG